MDAILLKTPLTKLTSQKFDLSFGILPEGNYIYYFGVINPQAGDFEISVAVIGASFIPITFRGSSQKHNYHFSFDLTNFPHGNDVRVCFQLVKGKDIFIHPTFFPQLNTQNVSNSEEVSFSNEIDNTFFIGDPSKREQLREKYRPQDIYHRLFKEVYAQNQKPVHTIGQPQVFYELLNLEEAKKQLEYVVYNKAFSDKNGNSLAKAKRKAYRKFLITIYKILTRTENRKNYVAKLYRNYININYISEKK